MYGGNEHGKLPETYTYEQFLEYRRAHGTDQTKKKLQEVEAKRLEKAAQNKKNGGGQTKHAGAGGGKHLSKNQISTTTKKQSLEDNKTKKEKQPTKLLDKLGFSSRSKKTKKKDALAQSDRPKKIKHHSFDADETFIDEPIMRKAASPTGGGEHGGPLVALPEGGHFDNKSHTGSSTTTSPNGSTNKSPITKSPVTSVFFNLDDASGKKPKRLKDRILSNPAAAQNEYGATKEAVTAKESRTSKEHKHLQPVTPPLSPKPKSDDDEFTPTVFELINAPVKPVTEKRKKARRMSELGHNKHPAALTVKESKKKILQPLEEDKTIEDDIAVDMEEDVKPKPKDLKKVKEKLKEKHQKMIERQKKIEKKKTEMELQKKLSKDSKKPDAATDRATANATSKKKQKRKSSNKKDKAIASKPTDKKVSETTAKSSTGIGNVAEPVDAKSPINSKTPTDSKDSDFNGDKTSKELTAEECDKTEEDEEIFTAKDEKLVRGIELRKIHSAKRFVERPPEKLRITASARIFGHRCENPRTQKATLKAIEKIKKTQKSSMPHKSATVSKSKSSTSPSSATGPTRSATTTWSSTSKSSTSLTSTSPSPGPTASATTTWSSTTCSEGGHK
uniref:Uncharacterized protein n=1 Tax=Panagrolaimus sp. PS1159 TaxID=55785 RepID=A0AC35G1P0_9BILA